MFKESPYHFTKLFDKAAKGSKFLIRTIIYEFKTEENKYLVKAEHYIDDIFIIKYSLKIHKNNSKRFNLLTNEGKCSRIIGTCLQIMMSLLKRHPLASFGFLGSHTVDLSNGYEEKRSNTKRFRIYKYAVEDLFGPETFSHFINEENSTYLIINNKNENVDTIADRSVSMFVEIFPQLEGI